MAFFDMVLIGVGLAADAFAAAVVRGLRIGRLRAADLASTALTFAFFQGAMTLRQSNAIGNPLGRFRSAF